MNKSLTRRMLLAASLVMLTPATPALAAEPAGPPVPLVMAADGTGVDGRYIVTVRPGVDVQALTRAGGLTAGRVYSSALRGFAAALDADRLESLRRNPDVVAIEQDRRWSLDETDAVTYMPTPNWGLDRIDQHPPPLNNTYLAPSGGSSVWAYIMDTGTDASHPDFGGRAQMVYDAFPGQPIGCQHHGTWTGGIVGSARFGVARNMMIGGLRVFDCDANTTTGVLLDGMEFILGHGHKPAVVNMSFGGPDSPALDAGAKSLWDNGFFVSASAGNDSDDACGHSPSRAVYSVASSNANDVASYFSNFGACVDIYAPGQDITGPAPGGQFHSGSGTSASAPFVTGAAALFKSMFGDAPSDTIADWLNGNATANAVKENEPGTPNRLLFIGPGLAPTPDGSYGYVYATSPQNPDYTPSIPFQRNTTGALNRVTRSALGTYRVHFPGLAGANGVAQVAMGNQNGLGCQLTAEGSEGTEQFLDVRCFDNAAQPVDAQFLAHLSRPAAGLSGAFGYARATVRSPGPGGPVYGAGTSYNSTGQPNAVTRVAAGQYLADFPGLGVNGGTAVVNAVGPEPRVCNTPDWFSTGTTERVLVSCRDISGELADGLFAVTFTDNRSILGTAKVRAHAWMPKLTTGTPQTPHPFWAFNSSGGPMTVTRKAAGKYDVVFDGVASSTRGHVMVAATGETVNRCRASVWDSEGADESVGVRCWNPAGQLVDEAFVVQFVW